MKNCRMMVSIGEEEVRMDWDEGINNNIWEV